MAQCCGMDDARKQDADPLALLQGIPLAATVAQALYEKHGRSVGFVYNRKEAKTHGEGGVLVGAPLKGRVLIIDDVMTAGTAIRESVAYIDAAPEAKLVGIAMALNRQERAGEEPESTAKKVQRELGVPVWSIVNVDDIMTHLEKEGGWEEQLKAMRAYREKYFGE